MTAYLESLVLTGETRQAFTSNRRHLYLFSDYLGDSSHQSVGYKEAQGLLHSCRKSTPNTPPVILKTSLNFCGSSTEKKKNWEG